MEDMSGRSRERIKNEINQILRDTGFVPAEEEGIQYAHSVQEDETVRKIFERAQRGELTAATIHEDLWDEARERDLKGNFLYAEYILHRLIKRDPLDFNEFARWTAIKAVFRLLSRVQHGDELLKELAPHLSLRQLRQFMVLDKHQEKDPRLLIKTFLSEISEGMAVINAMLLRYNHQVEDAWARHRVKNERTPLPGEKDWYFEELENPLEAAVESYLAGATINAAAQKHKISNRRLSRELTRLGIERVQRRGNS